MYRTLLINALISIFKYRNYLEIGVGTGSNFDNIYIENKECCDPNAEDADGIYPNVTYEMTSDEMFNTISGDKKWDIVFIDGLHEGNQVMKDLFNTMKHLSDDGIILIHDSIPENEESATLVRSSNGTWNGTVFKIYPVLKNLGVKFFIIDADCGLGIIPKQDLPENIPQESPLEFKDVFYDSYLYNNLNIINTDVLETFLNILVKLIKE